MPPIGRVARHLRDHRPVEGQQRGVRAHARRRRRRFAARVPPAHDDDIVPVHDVHYTGGAASLISPQRHRGYREKQDKGAEGKGNDKQDPWLVPFVPVRPLLCLSALCVSVVTVKYGIMSRMSEQERRRLTEMVSSSG